MMNKISSLADREEIVDLNKIIYSLMSSLICKIAFGTEFRETSLEKKKFDELIIETEEMCGRLFVSDYFPLFGWIDSVSGLMAKLESVFKNFDEFYQELIDSHLDPKGNNKKLLNQDILDMMIQLKEQKSCSIDITWDQIKAILSDIFLAATDTGAVTIIWVMTNLIKNPATMNKLQQEIRDVVKGQSRVTEDDIPKFVYLKVVIKETLRLFSPVPLLLPRETRDNCIIENYEVKTKTLVYVNAWAIARDPEYWENPEEFLPERFLNTDVDVLGQHFHVIPFGSGRRMCPGMTTVEIALANLVYGFNWELPPGMRNEDIDTEATLARHA